MSSNTEAFDALEQLAASPIEVQLTATYITSERLRAWLKETKEGKAVSAEIMRLHEAGVSKLISCDASDIKGMQEAKLDIEVSKRVYEMFSAIFEDGENAEKQLSGELN